MFSSASKQILDESKNILLCGCGGGYDIYCGLPIYHNYKEKITLANITFAHKHLLKKVTERDINDEKYLEIDYNKRKCDLELTYPDNYVPEYWLSKSLDKPVYAIDPLGVQTLIQVFEEIVEKHNIDTIVLIDGGIDSLMFGDEEDLGSFSEDMATMLAVAELPNIRKLLVTTAWGGEFVSHNRYFENVATMIREDGFLGAQLLEKNSDEGKFYMSILENCFPENSTINTFIYTSIIGQPYDKVHEFFIKREPDCEPNITLTMQDWPGSPIGAIYWFFDLQKVASKIVYADKIKDTKHITEVGIKVHHFRYDSKLVNDDGEYCGKRNSTHF